MNSTTLERIEKQLLDLMQDQDHIETFLIVLNLASKTIGFSTIQNIKMKQKANDKLAQIKFKIEIKKAELNNYYKTAQKVA